MANLKSHDVYELVPRVSGMWTLKLVWVVHRKIKHGVFGKNKGRLVARGNHQCPGIGYGESFSPVMRLEYPHPIPALAAFHDLGITSAYLHGTLKEEDYVEQPEVSVAPGKKERALGLKKGLYGLEEPGTRS